MSKLSGALGDIATSLASLHRYALVGGLAVSARTEPRFTRDVDLVVATADDAASEAVVFGLRQRGYQPELAIEQDKTGRLATVRLRRTVADPIIDLLFASSGIEDEIARAATPLTVLNNLVPVAMVGHLIVMKLLSRDDRRRPRDIDDLLQLCRVAADDDWALATTGVEQVTRRGYARGRDLSTALLELRARAVESDD